MVRRSRLGILLVGALILIVGTGLVAKNRIEQVEALANFPDRGLPRINITLNGVTLDEINAGSKDDKYEGNELTLYSGSEVREFENVRVKGRGNATWEWVPDKKSLSIKFEKRVDLFGLGKAKKWSLLANFMDDSSLRNDISFRLSNMLEMEPAFNGQFVELYIDNAYRGLYYLVRKVEISDTIVDLKDSLGVLVELDNIYGELEEINAKTNNGDIISVKEAVSDDNARLALNKFVETLNEFEEAVENRDYGTVSELIDVESFAKYYLLNEFTVNPDAYWTSFFMYKDGINDKIHAGPGWDFDFALANRGWVTWLGERFYSPNESMIRKEELKPLEFYEDNGLSFDVYDDSTKISSIIYNLMEMDEFREDVKKVYERTLSGKKDELLQYVSLRGNLIKEAAVANEGLWEKPSYTDEVSRLLTWIDQRYDYMDEVYGGNESDAEKELIKRGDDAIL